MRIYNKVKNEQDKLNIGDIILFSGNYYILLGAAPKDKNTYILGDFFNKPVRLVMHSKDEVHNESKLVSLDELELMVTSNDNPLISVYTGLEMVYRLYETYSYGLMD
ncbi:MAG: hypothetical protein ABH857_01795 [Elusimicrobiota bacterium]